MAEQRTLEIILDEIRDMKSEYKVIKKMLVGNGEIGLLEKNRDLEDRVTRNKETFLKEVVRQKQDLHDEFDRHMVANSKEHKDLFTQIKDITNLPSAWGQKIIFTGKVLGAISFIGTCGVAIYKFLA